jgi:hypothetical protein
MAEVDEHSRKVLDGFIPLWAVVGMPPSFVPW